MIGAFVTVIILGIGTRLKATEEWECCGEKYDAQKECLVEKLNFSRPEMDCAGSKKGGTVVWIRIRRCIISFSVDVHDVFLCGRG